MSLRSIVSEKLFSAVDRAISIAIQHEEGVTRYSVCPRNLFRPSCASEVEHHAILLRGQVESTARNIKNNWRTARCRASWTSNRVRVLFVPQVGRRNKRRAVGRESDRSSAVAASRTRYDHRRRICGGCRAATSCAAIYKVRVLDVTNVGDNTPRLAGSDSGTLRDYVSDAWPLRRTSIRACAGRLVMPTVTT